MFQPDLPAPLLRRLARITACLALCLSYPAAAPAQPTSENLFYMTGSENSFQRFEAHVDQISIVGPQVFSVEEDGVVWGQVDARVLALARAHGVKVMPLIRNPGFDQDMFHQLLHNPQARTRTVEMMVALAEEHDFYGWQFDFENIHVDDRDEFTRFYREAADALHAGGFTLSIAVVPTNGLAPATPYQRFMRANWRGSFDLKALADIGDFISLMTYDQHTRNTPPGPIAGLPWVRTMIDYALDQGVPPEKLSMGIPTYSGHWFATFNDAKGLHATGRSMGAAAAQGLLARFDADLTWMETEGTSYAVWTNRGLFEYAFIEDRRAFEAKLGLFASYEGLRGLSVWVLGTEDPGIWDALRERVETARID